MGAHEEATRYDDATLAGASSANHDAGQAVTEDRKHVEASAASRSEASTAVAASAYHHGLVRNQASYLSCALGGHLPTDRRALCRWARGREGYRERRDTPHARGINRRLATLFYAVTKNLPIQGRCDAEWYRCVSTATSDSACCSPDTFRMRRGSDPRAPATKSGASRCPVRAHPVAVT